VGSFTEERRACPACGARNLPDALSCWQCFERLTPRQGTVSVHSRDVGALAGPIAAAPESRHRVAIWTVAGAAFVGVFLIAWFTLFAHRGAGLPDSIGGYQKLNSPQDVANAEQIKKAWGDQGLTTLVSGYGQSGKRFVLTVVENPPIDFPPAPVLFKTYADQLGRSGQLTVAIDQMQQVSGESGVTFDCAPVGGMSFGSLCVWTGSHTAGTFLGARIALQEGEELVQEARAAVHG
jgi:hypothetical protein